MMWLSKYQFPISLRVCALFLLVGSLGALLRMDLWARAEILEPQSIHPPKRIIANSLQSRSPSSIKEGTPPESQNLWASIEEGEPIHQTLTIDWDCSPKNQMFRVSNVGQLRLSGKCLREIKGITNHQNGYTANIFKLKDNVTTDYVSLNPGSNRLHLEWLNGATGNLSHVLEIIVEKQ